MTKQLVLPPYLALLFPTAPCRTSWSNPVLTRRWSGNEVTLSRQLHNVDQLDCDICISLALGGRQAYKRYRVVVSASLSALLLLSYQTMHSMRSSMHVASDHPRGFDEAPTALPQPGGQLRPHSGVSARAR